MRVYIERDRTRLRIKVIYQGKKYQFSTGLIDSRSNMAYVQTIASRIQLDMISGQLDPTMMRYRPQTVGSNPSGINYPELLDKFIRGKTLSPGSLRRYQGCVGHVRRSLNIPAHEVNEKAANSFATVLQESVNNRTAREYLWMLKACWDWGRSRYHLGEVNPWTAQISKIKPSPRQRRKPFSDSEIRAILKGFKDHRYYRHYFPFVVFQINCGTRPGEASSLIWADISDDFTTALIRRSHSRGNVRQTTKTGMNREINLNPVVQRLLREIKPIDCDPNSLVFPSPKGKAIHDRLFCRRAWRTVIDACGIEYRPPYTLRHSALSHGYRNGSDSLELSRQAGNSLKTMQDCYLSSVENQQVFVEF